MRDDRKSTISHRFVDTLQGFVIFATNQMRLLAHAAESGGILTLVLW
jgi:hypothetical protein